MTGSDACAPAAHSVAVAAGMKNGIVQTESGLAWLPILDVANQKPTKSMKQNQQPAGTGRH